jgi:hypothetical protein
MHSMIAGLTIDGVEVIPQLDRDLCECQTYRDLTDKIYKASPRYAQQFGVAEADLAMFAAKTRPIHGSFVNGVKHQPTDKFGPCNGFTLPVKNFGYVHFGELFVKPGQRSVNLLRVELDSTVGIEEGGEEYRGGDAAQLQSSQVQAKALSSAKDVTTTTRSPSRGTMTVVAADIDGAPNWP